MQKIPKNSKIFKNDGHFRIPHPQISLKQFSNIFENVVYFFTMAILVFIVDILQVPHTVNLNSEKLTHPNIQ